jgi:two-component system response regulator YesN
LKNEVKETIDNLFDQIDLKSATALRYIRIIAMDIISVCLKNSLNMGLDPKDVYKSELESYNQIFLMDTLPDIKEYLNRVAQKTTLAIDRQQVKEISVLIENVKKYINENFSNNSLSLSSLAKLFFLNPSYLSRMFKKETGVSFVEYLTSIRMEKAITLLNRKEIKAFEISDAVGISDSNYFCTCFKKYTGKCVSDFKRSLVEKVS